MNSDLKQHIVINLSNSFSVKRISNVEEFFQRDAFAQLIGRLKERVDGLNQDRLLDQNERVTADDDSLLMFNRVHEIIMLHGGRGSGKTTFLRNALLQLHRPNAESYLNQDLKFRHQLSILGVVDPTLLGTKEHIVVIILNKIRSTVERETQELRNPPTREQHLLQEWKMHLKSLAEGVSLLESVGSDKFYGSDWDDPQYVLLKGLDRARSSASFEDNFAKFIEKSLILIRKEAFLLAFDDLDTNFSSGWAVLEGLRKYLSSRRFIIVMAGDMDLYAMLVKSRQAKNFAGDRSKDQDGQNRSSDGMLNHLQSQYLLKLFSPRYRIPLQSLYALRHKAKVRPVKHAEPESQMVDDEDLGDFLNRLMRDQFSLTGDVARAGSAFLLRSPIRTLLEVLALNSPKGSKTGALTDPNKIDALAGIFVDVMLRHGVSPDEFRETGGEHLLIRIASFLTDNKLWDAVYALTPVHEREDLNAVSLVMGARLAYELKQHPYLCISYMIRIAFAHELISSRLPAAMDVKLGDRIERFVEFVELQQDGPLVRLAARFVAALVGAAAPTRLGTIQLYNPGSLRKDAIFDEFINWHKDENIRLYEYWKIIRPENSQQPRVELGFEYNTISTIVDRMPDPAKSMLASAPVMQVLRANGDRPTYMTVHGLVGLLGDLMALRNGEGMANVTVQSVLSVLRSAATIRTYQSPSWDISSPDRADKLVENLDYTEVDYQFDATRTKFPAAIIDWLDRIKGDSGSPPPYVLARMWSRFFFTISNMDEHLGPRDRFAGWIMHRHIIAFLHSVLSEDFLSHGSDAGTDDQPLISPRNPTTRDQIFESSYRRLIDDKDGVGDENKNRFFRLIFSCPLWGLYLDPISDVFRWHCALARTKPELYSIDLVRSASDRESSPITVTFPNLYLLYNSLPVMNLVPRAASSPRKKAPSPNASA